MLCARLRKVQILMMELEPRRQGVRIMWMEGSKGGSRENVQAGEECAEQRVFGAAVWRGFTVRLSRISCCNV